VRKWIQALAVGVCGIGVSLGALASPTYLYTFTTHQSRCIGPEGIFSCASSYDFRPALNRMSYRLTEAGQAAGGGWALMDFQHTSDETVFKVEGLAELTLPSYGSASSIALSPDSSYWESWYTPFYLGGTFAAGPRPWASFYFFDGGDEVAMGGGIDILLNTGMHGTDHLDTRLLLQAKGPFEVQGLIIGDANHPSFFSFTGQWRYAGDVPEPGTAALLLLALAGTAFGTRQRRRPGRFAGAGPAAQM
jgi:hypothetical protein